MNLIHEQVMHRQFGIGSIIEQEEKVISIKFSGENDIKMFEYPLAFDKYLTFCNADLQGKILDEVRLIKEQIETERRHKEEEYQKLQEEKRLNNLALKKTASKKHTPAKKGTKKASSKSNQNQEMYGVLEGSADNSLYL
ncbi:MAG: hypothetical protein H6Q71_2667 [Firmicutes bacterium]|nr:hypothetical protein [Bacillota bacterium]